MVVTGLTFTWPLIFKTGQGWEHVNWWPVTTIIEVPWQNNLTFGDITGQVRNWMGNVIFWHGQDWNLGNRTLLTNNPPSTLVEGRQVSIEITRVTTTTWHFPTCCWDFTQSFTVVSHVSHNNQNVHILLISQVFCCRQGNPRRCNPFDSWVIGQVDEEDGTVHSTCFAQVIHEEFRFFKGNPHSGKDHGEVFIWVQYGCLTSNLCG